MQRMYSAKAAPCPDDHELLGFIQGLVSFAKFEHLRYCKCCLDKLRFAGHFTKVNCLVVRQNIGTTVVAPNSRWLQFRFQFIRCFDDRVLQMQPSTWRLSGGIIARTGAYLDNYKEGTYLNSHDCSVVLARFENCRLSRSVRKTLLRGARVYADVVIEGRLKSGLNPKIFGKTRICLVPQRQVEI